MGIKYKILLSKQAQKDAKKVEEAALKNKVLLLISILKRDPFFCPPFFEKLKGDLEGFYSRRINKQHRLVYEVNEEKKIVRVLRMWTHYE